MTRFCDDVRTARCRIAPLDVVDAPALAAITDASVTERIHFLPEPFTANDAHALLVRRPLGDWYYGIRERHGDALLGVIGAHFSTRRRAIEIGYWLAAAARGRGIAQEALYTLTQRLALAHPDRQIIAECHPDNARSWDLLQRTGFAPTVQAGRRPGRVLFVHGAADQGRIDVC